MAMFSHLAILIWLTNLSTMPTKVPTYLFTYHPPTYVLPTYYLPKLHIYLPTYLPIVYISRHEHVKT
jgi:hypothetical protein